MNGRPGEDGGALCRTGQGRQRGGATSGRERCLAVPPSPARSLRSPAHRERQHGPGAAALEPRPAPQRRRPARERRVRSALDVSV